VHADVGRAVGAMVGLIGLGLTMGFSPTLYDVVVHALTHPSNGRPIRLVAWMTAGLATASTLLLVVFRFVDPETLITLWKGRFEAFLVERTVDLIAGGVFLVAAVVVERFRRTRQHRARRTDLGHATPGRMFVAGFANTLIGVSGIATMYVTGRVITGGSPLTVVRGVEYVVFLVALVGQYLLIAAAWERFPAIARGVARLRGWLVRQDLRLLLALALAVTGVVFVVLAFRTA
jgi:hypothetical protein